jgi:hypothetical protein
MLTEILNIVREILKRLTGPSQTEQRLAAIEQRLTAIEVTADAIRFEVHQIHDGLFEAPGDREASLELTALATRAEAVAEKTIQLANRLDVMTRIGESN